MCFLSNSSFSRAELVPYRIIRAHILHEGEPQDSKVVEPTNQMAEMTWKSI